MEPPGSRLLVLHQGALGDVVVCFGPLLALKNRFESIHGICSRGIGKMAEDLGILEKSYPQESALFSSLYSDLPSKPLWDLLSPYDAILLFSFSDALAQNVSRHFRKPVHRIPPRPDVRKRIHVAEHLFQRLYACGLLAPADRQADIFPDIYMDRRDPDADPSRILIHPGSGSPKKNWPLERFMAVARKIEGEGYTPMFLLGPAEAEFKSRIPGETILPSDLQDLVKILKRAGGYIGNDSGVSHLAAFIGLPVVAVFGPSDHRRWKPLGRAVRVVAPEIECGSCFETGEKICGDDNCLDAVDCDAVLRAFSDSLNGKVGG